MRIYVYIPLLLLYKIAFQKLLYRLLYRTGIGGERDRRREGGEGERERERENAALRLGALFVRVNKRDVCTKKGGALQFFFVTNLTIKSNKYT